MTDETLYILVFVRKDIVDYFGADLEGMERIRKERVRHPRITTDSLIQSDTTDVQSGPTCHQGSLRTLPSTPNDDPGGPDLDISSR